MPGPEAPGWDGRPGPPEEDLGSPGPSGRSPSCKGLQSIDVEKP